MNIFKKLIMALIFFTDIVQFKHTFFTPPLSLHNVFALQGDLHFDDDSNFSQEYKRLKQAMEMVGFLASTKKQYVWFNAVKESKVSPLVWFKVLAILHVRT